MKKQMSRWLSLLLVLLLVVSLVPMALAAPPTEHVAMVGSVGYDTLHGAVEAAKTSQYKIVSVYQPVTFGQNGEPETTIELDVPGMMIVHYEGADLHCGDVTAYHVTASGVQIAGSGKFDAPGKLLGSAPEGIVRVEQGGSITDLSIAIEASETGVALDVEQGGSVTLPAMNVRYGTETPTFSSGKGSAVVLRGDLTARECWIFNSVGSAPAVLVDGGNLLLLKDGREIRNRITGYPALELRSGNAKIYGAQMDAYDHPCEIADHRAVKTAIVYGGRYRHPFDGSANSNDPALLGEGCTVRQDGSYYEVLFASPATITMGSEAFEYGSWDETVAALNDLGKQNPGKRIDLTLNQDIELDFGQSAPVLEAGNVHVAFAETWNMARHYTFGSNGVPALEVRGGQLHLPIDNFVYAPTCLTITGGAVYAKTLHPETEVNGPCVVYLDQNELPFADPVEGIVYTFVDYDSYQDEYTGGYGTVYGNPDLTGFFQPPQSKLGSDLDEYVQLEGTYTYGDAFFSPVLTVNKIAVQGTVPNAAMVIEQRPTMEAGENTVVIAMKSSPYNRAGYAGRHTFTFQVAKSPLTLEQNTYSHYKRTYDGTADIDPTELGQVLYLSGEKNSDSLELNRDYTVEAQFDTPDVGENKPIRAKVTLLDSELGKNYVLQTDTADLTGSITRPYLKDEFTNIAVHVKTDAASVCTVDLLQELQDLGTPYLEGAVFEPYGYSQPEMNSTYVDTEALQVKDNLLTLPIRASNAPQGTLLSCVRVQLSGPVYNDIVFVNFYANNKTYLPMKELRTAGTVPYTGQPVTGYIGTPDYEGQLEITYEGVYYTEYGPTAEPPVRPGNYMVSLRIPDSDPVYANGSRGKVLPFSIKKGIRPADTVQLQGLPDVLYTEETVQLTVTGAEDAGYISWSGTGCAQVSKEKLTTNANGGMTGQIVLQLSQSDLYENATVRFDVALTPRQQPPISITGVPEVVKVGDNFQLTAVGGLEQGTYYWNGSSGSSTRWILVKDDAPITVTVAKKWRGYEDATATVTITPVPEENKPQKPQPKAEVAQDSQSVTITLPQRISTGTCMVAAYDEAGRLLSFQSTRFSTSTEHYETKLTLYMDLTGYKTLKLFGVDGKCAPTFDTLVFQAP